MSCVAKHHRAVEASRSVGRGSPVDVWLLRQMKAEYDSALNEPLPAQWLDLLQRVPSDEDDQNSP